MKSWLGCVHRRTSVALWLVFALLSPIKGEIAVSEDVSCCHIVSGSCRSSCEQISMWTLATATKRDNSLDSLRYNCPQQMIDFWRCLNKTLTELDIGSDWLGRPCCSLPQSTTCQLACLTANSKTNLYGKCRQSDEIAFFNCLDRQETGDLCCSHARSSECHRVCRGIFQSNKTPNRSARNTVINACAQHSSKVIDCVQNHTRVTPAKNPEMNLFCCDQSPSAACRDTCKRILTTKDTDQEIIDDLIHGGCGPVLPHDKLWQCFLYNSHAGAGEAISSRIDKMGMDSAKLHCCSRAEALSCRKLCYKTFSREWNRNFEEFDKECLNQVTEWRLTRCVEEVDGPCELGCDGLSYCTNFNNRPTELFRSCTREADQAALLDFELWAHKKSISLPGIEIPVKDINECYPEVWKSIACTLQMKPCHRRTHLVTLCRKDCLNILKKCLDPHMVPQGYSAESICSFLPDNSDFSNEGNEPSCISLEPYLEASTYPYVKPSQQVTMPCKGHPCGPGYVCQVNRSCRQDQSCFPYYCVPGCKMGEVSPLVVPQNSFVKIPQTGRRGVHQKICRCSERGVFEDCRLMDKINVEHCWVGTRRLEHGSQFNIDCHVCSCFAGEIICSKRACLSEGRYDGNAIEGYTGLPCNCPNHFVPVCGRNGKTYPSACVARCSGLEDADLEYGSCSHHDPCQSNVCGPGNTCAVRRRVCLSLHHRKCSQFICVPVTPSCNVVPEESVCDTENNDHRSMCEMEKRHKKLAYFGKCLFECKVTGVVCGINGHTYPSECAALVDRILIDYPGPCQIVGLPVDTPRNLCHGIKCSPLPPGGCIGVTPPGACCPICAGALRLLYSHKQLKKMLDIVRDSDILTVKTMIEHLRMLIQVAECDVYGYLSIEGDVVVLVVPVSVNPSELQLITCVKEAEKLESLIQLNSPRILSDISLSTVTMGVTIHSHTNRGATLALPHYPLLILCLLGLFWGVQLTPVSSRS